MTVANRGSNLSALQTGAARWSFSIPAVEKVMAGRGRFVRWSHTGRVTTGPSREYGTSRFCGSM